MIILTGGILTILVLIYFIFQGCFIFGFMGLAIIIFPILMMACSILGIMDDVKRAKKGEIKPLKLSDYIYCGIWFIIGLWFLIGITIPFLIKL